MNRFEIILDLPNRLGRRYRIVHPGTRDPEVFVEVFTSGRRRTWRHLPSHGKRQKERAAVLALIGGRAS